MSFRDSNIKTGVSRVARLIGLSIRTTWRKYRIKNPDSGEKHPLGELMWEDGSDLCINSKSVEKYFNDCRRAQGKRPLANIKPLWGVCNIARRTGLSDHIVRQVARGKKERDVGEFIWIDPYDDKPILDLNGLEAFELAREYA